MMLRVPTSIAITSTVVMILLLAVQAAAQGSLTSYSIGATDDVGSTGASANALGVADYLFINDDGLGFGGTNTDVFDVGEATTMTFPFPLHDVPGQHDLIISAYVGGLGEIDDATVQVEVSSDGALFSIADTFDTSEARNRDRDRQENDHPGVKHFWIDFAGTDAVTHVRLTNLAGTAEGLRLDSVEGVHPDTDSTHAFEVRFERYRVDGAERFLFRLKNVSDTVTGQPVTGFYLERSPPNEWLEETIWPFLASDGVGSMICVFNCVDDADMSPGVPSAEWGYSLDDATPAPPGVGLEPGRYVAHERFRNIDVDTNGQTYLTHFTFYVEFADGRQFPFTWNEDVVGFGNLGQLYQKYTYYNANPALSGPRDVHHYESVEIQFVPGLDPFGRLGLTLILAACAIIAILRWRPPNPFPEGPFNA